MEKVKNPNKTQGEKAMRQILSILIIGLFVSISGASAFADSPPVSWLPSEIDVTVNFGDAPFNESVTITSDIDLGTVEVFIVPELRPFVTVTSSTISVGTGQSEIILTFDAPLSEVAGIYDGTIHLRKGSKTIAKPLSVVVRVGEEIGVGGGTFTSDDGKATLVIPQGAISGNPLLFGVDEISIDDDFYSPPTWGTLMGPVVYDFYPDGAVFYKPLELTITYDPTNIPSGFFESDMRIGYEKENGDIAGLEDCVVNEVANTVTCSVWHFTRFIIIATSDITAPDDPTPKGAQYLDHGTPQFPDKDSTIAVLDWDNPSDPDFSHAKIYIYKTTDLSLPRVIGDMFLTEVKKDCEIDEVGCTEGPTLEIPLEAGVFNCFWVRAVDRAGNESSFAQPTGTTQPCLPGPGL